MKTKWKILTRSAFKLYKLKVELIKSDENSEARAQYNLKVRRERVKRKIFNAISVYVHTFKHS